MEGFFEWRDSTSASLRPFCFCYAQYISTYSRERLRRVLRKKTSAELRLIYIFTSSPLHIHILTYISAHVHICASTSLLIFTSAHLHLCSSSHPHIYISHLHLSLFFTFSLKAGGGAAAGAPRNATLCGDRACRGREMQARVRFGFGARKRLTDWTEYFQQQDVFHIQCHLEGTTFKPARRWLEQIPDLVASCLRHWKFVCDQLWEQSMLAVGVGKSMHALFHCFGGINRSAGILCAWLVVAYKHSAQEAVQLLLQKNQLCVLGALERYGTWKVCARNGRETSAQHTEANLCRGSSVETVRDEPTTSSLK